MVRMLFYIALASMALAGTAYAKGRPAPPPGKVIKMNVLRIKGRVQKPRVTFILERQKIKYKGIPLKEDFLKKVETPLQEDMF